MNDSEILELLKIDKKAGFELFINKFQGLVFNLAYSHLGNREDTNDLSQDVFVKVYDQIHTFRGLCSLSTWLYRITLNACHDHARKRKRYKVIPIDDTVMEIRQEEKDTAEKELEDRIAEALLKLPVHLRDIIILKDRDDLSYLDISKILGCSLGTVESRLFRARKKMRQLLKKENVYE